MRFRVLLGLLLFCAAGIWTMADETEAASGEAWNEDGSVTITTETFPDDWFRETVAQKFICTPCNHDEVKNIESFRCEPDKTAGY